MFNLNLLITNLSIGSIIEIIVLLIVFGMQIYISWNVYNLILQYKKVFLSKFQLIESDGIFGIKSEVETNRVLNDILYAINRYLLNNSEGVIDFHLIKDIIDRNIENIEEEISSNISAPLYLGLAGTMIGIIAGLFSLNLETTGILEISPLIDGIKYAMFVSLIGLILTTYLNIIVYRDARSKVGIGQNYFLSLIQSDLLPTLKKSDETGIQELSLQLRNFSNKVPEFVNSMDSNSDKIQGIVQSEIRLLEEVRALDVRKMSSANASIFQNLSKMMGEFEAFPRYYAELNSSLGNTIELNNNIKNIVNSSDDFRRILQELKSIINTSNNAAQFFNEKIGSFDKYADVLQASVAITDQKMEKAIGQLSFAVNEQFETYSKMVIDYDQKLTQAFENSIDKFNSAFINVHPQFKELEKLSDISGKLDQLNKNSKKQFDAVSGLEISLPNDMNLKVSPVKNKLSIIRDIIIIMVSICLLVSVTINLYYTFF